MVKCRMAARFIHAKALKNLRNKKKERRGQELWDLEGMKILFYIRKWTKISQDTMNNKLRAWRANLKVWGLNWKRMKKRGAITLSSG